MSPPYPTMLQRNLLYTGVTRGKRLVVLVGQKKAVAIAVRNVSGRRRWSKLNEWLSVEKDVTAAPQTAGGLVHAGPVTLPGLEKRKVCNFRWNGQ